MYKILPWAVRIGYKWCFACDDELPVNRFYTSKRPSEHGYQPECKKCRRARAAALREGKKAVAIAYARQWRKDNPGYWRVRKARDPEKWNTLALISNEKHKAVRKQAPGAGVTREEWAAIKEEYGHRCAYCAQKTKLTMDHVQPVSKGGAHDTDNVVPACKWCNSSKWDRPILTWLAARVAA